MDDLLPGQAAAAYLRGLAATGRACDHPPRFRVEVEAFRHLPFEAKRLDPNEWECQVCGTMQLYRGAQGRHA